MARIKKLPVVLFFIAGVIPTEEEQAEAEAIEADVKFRNASLVGLDHAPEDFDDVAGAVPDVYAEAKAAKEAADKPARKSAKAGDEGKEPGKSAAAGWKPNA
ncbi:hypothetical protein [Sphingomonas phage Kimi]|nr:hypothetical protein [Sphingomonas phage Kimi]